MSRRRVQLFNQSRGVEIDTDATVGAVVGQNLFLADGTVVTVDMILNVEEDGDGLGAVYWRTIQERPPNVDALAAQEGAGLYVITGPGASETREISSSTLSVQSGDGVASDPVIDLDELEDSGSGALMAIERDEFGRVAGTKDATITGVDGEVDVDNGDAVGGLPTIGLADVPDEGGGTLQRIQRDAKGRVSGTSDATTDDLPEGSNLYFTDERARTAAVTDEIDPLATDTAPSGRAVAEVLDGVDLSGYAELSADNVFTGAENRFEGNVWLTANILVEDLSDISGYPLSSIRTPEKSVPIMVSSGAITEAGASTLLLGGGAGVQINTQDALGFNAYAFEGPMTFQSSGVCNFHSFNDDVSFNGFSVRPVFDDYSILGSPPYRWAEVFAVNGAINTSDARHKTDPRDMTSEEIACAADIARLPCVFRWLHAIEDKGEEARLHIGPTVQAVITSMESHGLDPMRYGFVCYDEWEAQEEKSVRRLSPEGGLVDEVLQESLPAGDVYSLRPTELANFVMRGLAHRQDELEQRLAALEDGVGKYVN